MRRLLVPAFFAVVFVLSAPSCGDSSARSGFVVPDAGSDGPPLFVDGGPDSNVDPALGGPCVDDGQCDDGIACTLDACDKSLSRCRFQPQHTLCRDDIYCDGEEICEFGVGCREGEPVACSDMESCTIDTCIEATRECTHVLRDADGDGDGVWNCEGGGDCDDTNPRISSKVNERCKNKIDDDCDAQVDEVDCSSPLNDTCADPLIISGDGTYSMDLTAAALDYPTKCSEDGSTFRDAVVALQIPDGKEYDVDLVATSSASKLTLGTAAICGDASTARCAASSVAAGGGSLSRLRMPKLAAGTHVAYVAGNDDSRVQLKVRYQPVAPEAQNETCANAEPLKPGEHRNVSLVDAERELQSACAVESGDLVYSFELTEPQDAHIYAVDIAGFGTPTLSLRNAQCTELTDELSCESGSPAHLFARALPKGKYFVSVGASGPTDLDLLLELKPASDAPPEEGCGNPPLVQPSVQTQILLADRTDAVNVGCLGGARDATYALKLTEKRDVLSVLRLSQGDTGAVSLAKPPCSGAADKLVCSSSMQGPLRIAAQGLAAGDYRVIVESSRGSPVSLRTMTRRAVAPVLVAFSDTCESATLIPESGGRFQGSTVNVDSDYAAGCDVGGQAAGGARDQMLKLVLTAKRRVILDMKGSTYNTLLVVRQGPECPGKEVTSGCVAGYVESRSFLDLVLDPGEYFVQIDGYNGAEGAWTLDVFTGDGAEP